MAIAKTFRELEVYNLARSETQRIFELTKAFPRDERFSLTDQIRRSSRAVGAMIAAAWAPRRYKAAFISKLDEALEEAMETQAWLDHSFDAGYLSKSEFDERDLFWQRIGGELVRMMDCADACWKLPPHHTNRPEPTRPDQRQ